MITVYHTEPNWASYNAGNDMSKKVIKYFETDDLGGGRITQENIAGIKSGFLDDILDTPTFGHYFIN